MVYSDATGWVSVGFQTVPMGTDVYVGLAVTSADTAALNTSTFENVAIGTLDGGAPAGGGEWTASKKSVGVGIDWGNHGGLGPPPLPDQLSSLSDAPGLATRRPTK